MIDLKMVLPFDYGRTNGWHTLVVVKLLPRLKDPMKVNAFFEVINQSEKKLLFINTSNFGALDGLLFTKTY